MCPPLHPAPKDDYNRVLLKLDEGHSQDSSHDYEDDEEDESSDEEDDGPTKYINASHINVRLFIFYLLKFSSVLLKISGCFLNNSVLLRFPSTFETGVILHTTTDWFVPPPHHAGLLGPARLHHGPDSTARHHG